MKQLLTSKKIFYVIITLIIIIGILIVALKGFNVELKYQSNQKIELDLGEKVDLGKIQEKADEVFGKGNATVQIIEVYEESVQITAKEISEEQKNSMVEKVNDLYKEDDADSEETTDLLDASDITVMYNSNSRLRDMFKPYIVPTIAVTVVVLAYFAIRHHKLGIIKVLLKSALTLVLSEATLLSLMAITRIPMGRLTMPLVLLIYVSALIYISVDMSNKQKALK